MHQRIPSTIELDLSDQLAGRGIHLATVTDLFTREVVGFSVLTTHSVQLVMNAFLSAIHKHPHPVILHSDHGSGYTSRDYTRNYIGSHE